MAGDEDVAKSIEVAPDVASRLARQEVLILVEGHDAHPRESYLIETDKHLPTDK